LGKGLFELEQGLSTKEEELKRWRASEGGKEAGVRGILNYCKWGRECSTSSSVLVFRGITIVNHCKTLNKP
jgi:hypothetical protein